MKHFIELSREEVQTALKDYIFSQCGCRVDGVITISSANGIARVEFRPHTPNAINKSEKPRPQIGPKFTEEEIGAVRDKLAFVDRSGAQTEADNIRKELQAMLDYNRTADLAQSGIPVKP